MPRKKPQPEPVPGSLDGLPSRLRKKIQCDGPETHACWEWTGSFVKPRQRPRTVSGKPDYEGNASETFYFCNDRGLPTVHAPELGYATTAVRVVYARYTGRPLADVPRLGRCANDRCVSPHHVQDLGPVVKANPHAAALREMEKLIPQEHTPPHPRPQLVGDPNVEQPLDTLKRRKPATWQTISSAEDECDLPRGSVTPAIWAAYKAWDEEQDPDDA